MEKMLLNKVEYITPYDNAKYLINVHLGRYANGDRRIYSHYFDKETGGWMPFLTFTVSIPEVPLKDDEVIIKNYSENADALPWLYSWDIVTPVRQVVGNRVVFDVCKLLKE